jgi:hypothetical protein
LTRENATRKKPENNRSSKEMVSVPKGRYIIAGGGSPRKKGKNKNKPRRGETEGEIKCLTPA